MDSRKRNIFINSDKFVGKICIFLYLVLFTLIYIYIYNCCIGVFDSDYVEHINFALNGQYYSLCGIIIILFCGIIKSKVLFSLFMTIIVLLTTFMCALFIRSILKIMNTQIDFNYLLLLSIFTIFICKICVPNYAGYYVKECLSTQSWHNSTYTLMRFFAIPTLMFYFIIRNKYLDKVKVVECVTFIILLTLTNFAKPNFFIALAPVAFMYFFIDLIKSNGCSRKNILIFAVCFILSMPIFIFQYTRLFDANNSFGISFDNFIHVIFNKSMPIYIVTNYAYPLYILYLTIINRKKIDKKSLAIYYQVLIMFIVSFIERFTFVEIGARAAHGNFAWGHQLFSYFWFVISICMEIKLKKENIITNTQFVISNYTLLLHILYGICYFVLLLFGFSWSI